MFRDLRETVEIGVTGQGFPNFPNNAASGGKAGPLAPPLGNAGQSTTALAPPKIFLRREGFFVTEQSKVRPEAGVQRRSFACK